MMDKRTLLAFILIAVILILTRPFYERIGLAPTQPQADSFTEPPLEIDTPERPQMLDTWPDSSVPEELSPTADSPRTSPEKRLTVDTDLYVAGISSRGGGTLTSFKLKDYLTHDGRRVDLVRSPSGTDNLLIEFISLSGDSVSLSHPFHLVNDISPEDTLFITGNDLTLTFSSDMTGGPVTRSLTFHPETYVIDILVDLTTLSRSQISQERFLLTWNQGLPVTEKNFAEDTRNFKGNLYQGGEITKVGTKKDQVQTISAPGRTAWTSLRSKYFTSALIPRDESHYGFLLAHPYNQDNRFPPPAPSYEMAVGFSSKSPVTCSLYLGPLKYNLIKQLKVDLEETMSFGWILFRPFSKGVLLLLTAMHRAVPNYGVLLIIFSVLVKLVLYPLTRKSFQSTKEMQAIQPLIAGLREKHKGDPQRLNRATMSLYKEHGVNPLGGCLPMVLQMPLLIGVFIVFQNTIELRAAPFVWWIKDLSAPDALIPLGARLPILGWDQISLLPLLMGASMFIQQRMMGTPAMAQQKFMTYFMTGFFVLIFNQFPAGLNLYYTLFNVLTIVQQKYLTHPAPAPAVPAPSKKK